MSTVCIGYPRPATSIQKFIVQGTNALTKINDGFVYNSFDQIKYCKSQCFRNSNSKKKEFNKRHRSFGPLPFRPFPCAVPAVAPHALPMGRQSLPPMYTAIVLFSFSVWPIRLIGFRFVRFIGRKRYPCLRYFVLLFSASICTVRPRIRFFIVRTDVSTEDWKS